MSSKSRNRQRKTRVDRLEEGTRARTDHLLERVSAIENAIARLHGVRCPCGSREVAKERRYWSDPQIETRRTGESVSHTGDRASEGYTWAEIRCFYCHRLLEAYGVGG